jgi:hypothetical protein
VPGWPATRPAAGGGAPATQILAGRCRRRFAQAPLAGQFLSGNAAARLWHQGNAELIQLVALVQLVAAAVAWARGGPAWPTAASGLLLLAVGAQVALGYTHQVAVHVPLGVAILGLTVWLLAGLHLTRPRE